MITGDTKMARKTKPVVFINEDGVKVTLCPPAPPRANEKTFRNNRYSIFNMGAQASKLGTRGAKVFVDSIE